MARDDELAPGPPPPPPEAYNSVSDSTVITGFYINAALGAFLLISFCVAQTLNKKLYRFRAFSESVSLRPPDIPMSGAWLAKYWMWAVFTWRATDLDILMSCGLDAFVFTKVPLMGMQLFAPLAFLSITVLIPVHWTQTWLLSQGGTVNSSDLARVTLSAVAPGDPIMWVHVGLLFLYTFYGLGLLYYHFVQFARLRLRYMSRGDDLSFFAEIVTDKVTAIKKQLAHHNAKNAGGTTAGGKISKPSRAVVLLERRLNMLLKVMDGVHKRIHDLEQLRAEAQGPLLSSLEESPDVLAGTASSGHTPAAASHGAALHTVLEETVSGAAGSKAGSSAMMSLKFAGPVAEGRLRPPATQAMTDQAEFTWATSRPRQQNTQARRPLRGAAQSAYRTRGEPVAEGADSASSPSEAASGAALQEQASDTPDKRKASGPRGIGSGGSPSVASGGSPSVASPALKPVGSVAALSAAADAAARAHMDEYQVTGAGRMGAAKVDTLKELAPVMFLERPSVRFQNSILVPAQQTYETDYQPARPTPQPTGGLKHQPQPSQADTSSGADTSDHNPNRATTTATDPPHTTYPSNHHELNPSMEEDLPWGDPGHTGRPHLQTVQVCRYAVLVTDVPVPPFVPPAAPVVAPPVTRGGSTGLLARTPRVASGTRQRSVTAAFYEGSTLGNMTRRQSVERERTLQHGFVWEVLMRLISFVFPSYGLVAEMLDELQVSVEEQDVRDQEEEEAAAAQQREQGPGAGGRGAVDQDVEMAAGAGMLLEAHGGGSTRKPVAAGGSVARPEDVSVSLFGPPLQRLYRVSPWRPHRGSGAHGVNGEDANVSGSLQSPGQLLQLGSLRAHRKHPSSSSLRQRRTSGPSQGAAGSGPSYNSAFASSTAQRTTTTLDGEDLSEVFAGVSKVDKERASRAVRAFKAQSRGWQLWATARAAVRDGRVARLPASPAYDPVSAVFKALLPHDFDRVIPVLDYRKTHLLLRFWNWHMMGLDTALAVLERQKLRPRHVPCPNGLIQTHTVDSVDYLTKLVDKTQRDIIKERQAVLDGKGKNTGCYFVLFKTQAAAAMCATQSTALAENRGKFLIRPAPSPTDINWHSLPVPDATRRLMRWAMLLPKIIVILFPVAAFSSAFMQLDYVFCPTTQYPYPSPPVGAPNAPPAPQSSTWSWEWYCAQDTFFSKLFKSLIVGWAPSWILSLYTAVILPNALHGLSQATYSFLSLSSLDMEVCHLFWWFNVINVFLCGMLGATFMQQLNQALFQQGAAAFLRLLGAALPASSNFFINYLTFKALVGFSNKLLIPYGGVFWYVPKRYLFRCYKTVSVREKAFKLYTTRSPRHGPNVGNMLMVFVVASAFAVVSPIVPGVAVVFFVFGYFTWKYLMMYIFVRKYETGGIYFHVVFERLLACLMIMVLFTAAAIATKQGINQFLVIMCTLPWAIASMGWYCRRRYGPMLNQRLPFEVAARAPHARVNPEMYIHPALHPQALGWHPDLHLAWGGIGIWGTL